MATSFSADVCTSFYSCAEQWQDFIAGVLALLSALGTILFLYRQSKLEALRKLRGARTLLPQTLDELENFEIACVRWLESLREKARKAETGEIRHPSIPINGRPRLDRT